MSLKTRGTATLLASMVAVGGMVVATTPASAEKHRSTAKSTFTNWVVSGSLTPKKLGQPVTLPEGSTFNGSAEIEYENYLEEIKGTMTGTVFVPPFNASLNLAGVVPTTVGVTFTQVGKAEGVIGEAPLSDCSPKSETCVTVDVATRANVGITFVGTLGIDVPTHCETSEPITFDLSDRLPLFQLDVYGPHFAGTTTIPSMGCSGPEALVLAPLLTTLMSGPENRYVLDITRPGLKKPVE